MEHTSHSPAGREQQLAILTPTAIAWLLRNRQIDGRTVQVGEHGPEIRLVLA
ncbi:hypothetical protein ACTQ49_05115 [Luteococcus sp. Sow4_B9]|uniref:hypothetical protein n=1 Tax=Luteococcus sp. Sow4_B9 TaxID=3438792 RepID=UPI003F9D0395